MKKNVRYVMAVLMVVVTLCGLNGCSGVTDHGDTEQLVTEVEDEQIVDGTENEQILGQDSSGKMDETVPNEKHNDTEKTPDEKHNNTEKSPNEEHNDTETATSGEDLDVVVPNAADDDWYMRGNVYTDDQGNRLEVFFNDHGVLQFAVNGLSMYITRFDNFEQENDWKVYTCDDGTMVIYYPGEPAHLEIADGDYAGLYESN